MMQVKVGAAPLFDAEKAMTASQCLGVLVTELTALQINAKQAHWVVRGANFLPIHEFFDTLVDHAHAWTDEAAERVVALGLPIDARLRTVTAETKTANPSEGFLPAELVIREILAQIDIVLAAADVAIEELENDPASQDVAIGIRGGLDKDRWFLSAHVTDG